MRPNVNISIDDVSPHPLSSIAIIEKCNKILDVFPDAKFSLFVPISYWRTKTPNASSDKPFQINLFSKFCNEILDLPDESFEICYHGFYHGIPHISDNDEFRDLSKRDAEHIIEKMFEVVKLAGLFEKFKPIFRPPAWRMSPGSFEACKSLGIRTLALLKEKYTLECYEGCDEIFDNVVYANCYPPIKELSVFKNTEIVYHACEWDQNYLSDSRVDELIEFLMSKEFNFCFIEGLIDV